MKRLTLALALSAFFAGPALAVETSAGLSAARETLNEGLEWVSMGIEAAGVAVILGGVIGATALFVHGGLFAAGWPDSFQRYRANLGRGILLGLELLVAADIIGTVAITPSFENLAVLGLIVVIRTFLSFSLEVETEGRWPWQRAGGEKP